MKSIREQLQPGEEVVYVAHPTRVTFNASLIALVVLLLATAIIYNQAREPIWALGPGLLALPFLFSVLNKWVYFASNQYVLTNRRVIKQSGLVSKQSVTSYLDKINNVEHRQTFSGRMFGYGDVEVDTASETGTTRFAEIANPVAFQRAILIASEEYRATRGGYATAPAAPSGADRLRDLKRLLDDGLISAAEYEEKRLKMVAEL